MLPPVEPDDTPDEEIAAANAAIDEMIKAQENNVTFWAYVLIIVYNLVVLPAVLPANLWTKCMGGYRAGTTAGAVTSIIFGCWIWALVAVTMVVVAIWCGTT